MLWFPLTPPNAAVQAMVTKMRSDMMIPPKERKEMEDRSLSQRVGSATSTATTVSSCDADRGSHEIWACTPESTKGRLSLSEMV